MKTLGIIIVLFLSINGFAQYREAVTLRNGSVIRGKVTVKTEDQIRVQKKDGSIVVLNPDDVIAIEEYNSEPEETGYYGRGTLGLLGGPENASISLQVVQGYYFSKRLAVGGGFGFEVMGGNLYVPTFVESQFNILNKSSSPFVKILAGYQTPMDFSRSHGGFTGGAALGFTKYFGRHIGLTTQLGYRYARLKEMNGWWDDNFNIRQVNRFDISFGLTIR